MKPARCSCSKTLPSFRCFVVIQLAESLGLTSLAEGIETEEQLTFLRDNGCRLGQGFLFSPAVPPDQIVAFYRGGPFASKST